MARTRVQVRLFVTGGPVGGRAFRAQDVLEATWRISRLSGYAEGALTLAGLPEDHPGLANDARIEFWGWDDTQQSYVRLYRGYVLQSLGQGRTGERVRQTQITLYGFWDRLARQITLQRYLWAAPQNLATIFQSVVARWASAAIVGSAYVTDYQATTTTLEQLDAYRVPLSTVLERLDSVASRQLVAGADVEPATGQNRVYLRPMQAQPSLVAALPDPSNHVELVEDGRDARQRANLLHLRGGTALYPNLMAAMTRSQDGASGTGNAAFQVPRLGGGGYGDMVLNGGFETGDFTDWSVIAGDPAIKDSSDPGGPAYEGSKFLELDNDVGIEKIRQTYFGIVAGGKYTLDYVVKAESATGTPPEVLWTLKWYSDPGLTTLVQTDTISAGGSASPIPATWTQYQTTTTAPLGSTHLALELSVPVASVTFGVNFDSIQLYQSDVLYQEGWETDVVDGGLFGMVDWTAATLTNAAGAPRAPFWGAYSPLVRIAAASVGDEAILRPRGSQSVAVQGGNAYRFSAWFLSPLGATGTPARALVIQELDKDQQPLGAGDGIKRLQIQTGGVYNDWTESRFLRVLSQQCRYVRCWIEFQEAGAVYVGATQLRDARSLQGEFVEDEVFTRVLRVDDASLSLTPPTSTSIADLGLWPDLVGEEAIYNEQDATSWGRAALEQRARELLRPRVVWVGSPTLPGSSSSPWPGQVIKAVGAIATKAMPDPQPIVEVSGEWSQSSGSMMLRMTATLSNDPETEARVLQRILKKLRLVGR